MIEVPSAVGEVECTTPARVSPRRALRGRGGVTTTSTTSPITPTPDDIDTLLDEPSTSHVVREALDGLLVNVIKQLEFDLTHGPQATKSKIAGQFLPRIMKTLDKEDAEDQTQLAELRAEMQRLNEEMLTGEPVLYQSSSPHVSTTPDSEDLPVVDEETGITIERT